MNKLPEKTLSCPIERSLWDYRSGFLSKRREDGIRRHLFRCRFCLEALLVTDESLRGIGFDPEEPPSKDSLERVVSFAKRDRPSKSLFQKSFWLFLSLFSIGLSFLFSRFFLQWLILGLLFGLKWVFDTATNRTLIVMYDHLIRRKESDDTREVGRGERCEEKAPP